MRALRLCCSIKSENCSNPMPSTNLEMRFPLWWNYRPDVATVERNGELLEVDPDEVAVSETIVVKTGERIPLDGIILEGTSTLDTAALTGESLPRSVTVGDEALSGCINQSGLLKIRVTKPFAQSTVSKILELVEEASERKSKSEAFITRFAKYYTPFVVIAAVLLSILPPILTGNFLNGAVWLKWVSRALTFLVISCPCALVISVPLSFFGGIGGASKNGILIKGSTTWRLSQMSIRLHLTKLVL